MPFWSRGSQHLQLAQLTRKDFSNKLRVFQFKRNPRLTTELPLSLRVLFCGNLACHWEILTTGKDAELNEDFSYVPIF